MISEIILEILYHLESYLGSFISSRKLYIISETISELISEILYDLGNYLLWSPFSAFVRIQPGLKQLSCKRKLISINIS